MFFKKMSLGAFFFVQTEAKIIKTKIFADFTKQQEVILNFFENKELVDRKILSSLIVKCGLYRLKGYLKPLLIERADGKLFCNQSIEKLIDLVDLDENLKEILLKYILKIEYRFSLLMSETISKEKNPRWYYCESCFNFPEYDGKSSEDRYSELINEVEKSTQSSGDHPHPGVQSFKRKNPTEKFPSWIVRECTSFGFWVHAFSYLEKEIKEKVTTKVTIKVGARRKDLTPNVLESWIRSLHVLRNACAHNALLINRNISHHPADAHNLIDRVVSGPNIEPRIKVISLLLESFFGEEVSKKFQQEIAQCLMKNDGNEVLIFNVLKIDVRGYKKLISAPSLAPILVTAVPAPQDIAHSE